MGPETFIIVADFLHLKNVKGRRRLLGLATLDFLTSKADPKKKKYFNGSVTKICNSSK